jgi:hypothetical protein
VSLTRIYCTQDNCSSVGEVSDDAAYDACVNDWGEALCQKCADKGRQPSDGPVRPFEVTP